MLGYGQSADFCQWTKWLTQEEADAMLQPDIDYDGISELTATVGPPPPFAGAEGDTPVAANMTSQVPNHQHGITSSDVWSMLLSQQSDSFATVQYSSYARRRAERTLVRREEAFSYGLTSFYSGFTIPVFLQSPQRKAFF